VVCALYANHPYEEPAFDLYPVHQIAGIGCEKGFSHQEIEIGCEKGLSHQGTRGIAGMGRVGDLPRPRRGVELLRMLAPRADLSAAQFVGDLRRVFRSVTTAAGACGPRAFRDPQSLVITGELKHHETLELLKRGVTAVCLGHYASERPLLDVLRARLALALKRVRFSIARGDRPPLGPVRV
jgi:putative NIF3 family GTP cyclohydrolase 1 type 2